MTPMEHANAVTGVTGAKLIAEASTLKLGVGPGAQLDVSVPGVGSVDVGVSGAASVVLSAEDNASGIEFSAEAGAQIGQGGNNVKGQLGKVEALMVAGQDSTVVKTEGLKGEVNLGNSAATENSSEKLKIGAHAGIIKVELEVDTKKFD